MTHHSDLASVAKALQEASHALHALATANALDVLEEPHTIADKTAFPDKKASQDTPALPGKIVSPGNTVSPNKTASPDREGEIRSYYFPPASVQQEKDLLRRHGTENFQGLLEEAHSLLLGQVKLMQNIHKEVRVRGYVIASLGAQLDQVSALLLRMRNIYDRVTPVQK